MAVIYGNPITIGGGTKLNIDYGTVAPTDTSKLWVPLSKRPSKVVADTVMDYSDNQSEVISCSGGSTTTLSMKNGCRHYSGTNTNSMAYYSGYFCYGKYIYFVNGAYLCRYNMETNAIETVTTALKYGSYMAALAIVDDVAYINCGSTENTWYGYGHTYNLNTNAAAILATIKRNNFSWVQSVVVGKKIYQFGGGYSASDSGSSTKNGWVYDTETGAVSYLQNVFETVSDYISAVAVGTTVYLFGGRKAAQSSYSVSGSATDRIMKFDTLTNTATTLEATLPYAGYIMSAVLFGSNIFIVTCKSSSYSSAGNYVNLSIFNTETETIQTVGTVSTSGGYTGLGACGAYGDSVYFIANAISGTAQSASVLKITPKQQLDSNVLFIQESFIPKNKVALFKNANVEILTDVQGVYLGNEQGYADRKTAYIYDNDASQWKEVSGESVYQDMLSALDVLGVN